MALVTLAQAKVGMSNKVDQAIIDQFQRGSMLMDMMQFEDAVSPGTGGSTMGYSYIQLLTPSTAAFRAINSEYDPVQAVREPKSVTLKILGGGYSVDRLLLGTAGAVDELEFQIEEKIKGVKNTFQNKVINGDLASDALEFDGLDVMLEGTSTEYNADGLIDLSTSALMTANYDEFLDMMDSFLALLAEKPDILMMNSKMLVKMKSVARRAGYFEQSKDDFGKSVANWDGIPMVDLEKYYNGSASVDVVGIDETTKETAIYAAVMRAKDGLIGVTPLGGKIISSYTPDLTAPGVMKDGDIEMATAIVLKNTLKAGVFRGIRVAASASTAISTVAVKGTLATLTSGTAYACEITTALADVVAADVVIALSDSKATVATATTADSGVTWLATVTAQDGSTSVVCTVNMTTTAT